MNIHTRKRARKNTKTGYIYEYYFFFEGDRYSESGYSTDRLAIEAGREHYRKLAMGKEPKKIYRCPLSFSQLVLEYLNIGVKSLSDNTKRTYGHRLHVLEKYIGDKKFWTIDYKTLQNVFNDLGKKYKAETNWNTRSALDALYRYAVRLDYVQFNPVSLIEVSGAASDDSMKPIEKEDFDQLYARFASDDRLTYKAFAVAMAIGYYTGMRKAEVFGLCRENVDFKNNCIHVCTQLDYVSRKENEYKIRNILKTKVSKATIPMPKQLRKIIKDWYKIAPESHTVICNKKGAPLSPIHHCHVAKEWAEEMGFQFTFHMLRHSYASNLIMNGVNIKVAQKLLRHKDASTTLKVYTHAKDKEMYNAVNEVFC